MGAWTWTSATYEAVVAVGRVDAVLAPSLRRRWSPTRKALAIVVSAGFTAPMLGKMLVSAT